MFQEQIFDQLCIDAWRAELSRDRALSAARIIINLAVLHQGSLVADFGCGVGLISLALAKNGMHVFGIDRSGAAIAEAEKVALPQCVFLESDWQDCVLPEPVDCAFFWFTSLCAGRERDLQALQVARRSLKDNGVLLLETRHWDRMIRQFQCRSERRSGVLTLIELHSYNPLTGFQETEEIYSTGGTTIRRQYHTRRYTFPEPGESHEI